MATIQCRVEQNPLTTPESYKLRFIPRSTGGYDDVAARLAVKNPVWTAELIKAVNQGDAHRGDAGHAGERLHVPARSSCQLVCAGRPAAADGRAAGHQHLGLASLELNDVVNSAGVLRLSGSNLSFDKNKPDCGCVIEGTAGGRTVQTQLASVSDTEILLVPHLPAQAHPWNNEFIVSVNTKYTENGTLRTGTYGRRLRSPLVLSGFGANNPQDVGILTGDAAAPYVKATAAQMSASERLRIQAVLDSRSGQLLLSLLAMSEHGAAGNAVTVAANGNYTLPGFSGSAVSSLSVKVENYTELVALLRSGYRGRMVDVLDVGM